MVKTSKYNTPLGHGKKCALLVSDMQRAYTECMLDDDFHQDSELNTIIDLVSTAHHHQIPVIYTIIAFDEFDIAHPNIWLQKIPQLAALKMGSPACELDPRLPFDSRNDMLIIKKHTSSFFGTQLANQLLSQHIDTLIVSGCTTSGCVRATTVEGMEHGFRIMVVKDAVADRWPESHEQTLFEINAKYGDVIDAAQCQQILKGSVAS